MPRKLVSFFAFGLGILLSASCTRTSDGSIEMTGMRNLFATEASPGSLPAPEYAAPRPIQVQSRIAPRRQPAPAATLRRWRPKMIAAPFRRPAEAAKPLSCHDAFETGGRVRVVCE